MQAPQGPRTGACPRCQGQKNVKDGVKVVPCPACLGKGQAGHVTK